MIYKSSGGTSIPKYMDSTVKKSATITHMQDCVTYRVKSLPERVDFTYFPKRRSK